MAKKTYIGVNNVARQVKKVYIGVNGVARKVKKIYIGVANIARQVFGGGELSYYGKATSLSEARGYFAATSVGNYALFGGGKNDNHAYYSTVDAYDTSLTRTSPTALSEARRNLAATSVGNYALFGGGDNGSGDRSTVDAYMVS